LASVEPQVLALEISVDERGRKFAVAEPREFAEVRIALVANRSSENVVVAAKTAKDAVEGFVTRGLDEKVEFPQPSEAIALLIERRAGHVAGKPGEEAAIDAALGETLGRRRRAGQKRKK